MLQRKHRKEDGNRRYAKFLLFPSLASTLGHAISALRVFAYAESLIYSYLVKLDLMV